MSDGVTCIAKSSLSGLDFREQLRIDVGAFPCQGSADQFGISKANVVVVGVQIARS